MRYCSKVSSREWWYWSSSTHQSWQCSRTVKSPTGDRNINETAMWHSRLHIGKALTGSRLIISEGLNSLQACANKAIFYCKTVSSKILEFYILTHLLWMQSVSNIQSNIHWMPKGNVSQSFVLNNIFCPERVPVYSARLRLQDCKCVEKSQCRMKKQHRERERESRKLLPCQSVGEHVSRMCCLQGRCDPRRRKVLIASRYEGQASSLLNNEDKEHWFLLRPEIARYCAEVKNFHCLVWLASILVCISASTMPGIG